MAEPVSASAVRQAVRGVMSAFPKGSRFAACKTRIVDGVIEVEVTLAPDSVQAPEEEGRNEAIELIRRRAGHAARS